VGGYEGGRFRGRKEEGVDIEGKETQEEVIEEYDKGKMLVLTNALSSQRSKKEEQRENIFHSRCIVHRKVCLLIIEGGSCANVVSLGIIEKLNLHTSTHPIPYSKGLRANSRCLILSPLERII